MNVNFGSVKQLNVAADIYRNNQEAIELPTAFVQVEGSVINGRSSVLPQAFPVLLVPPGESDEADGVLEMLPMPYLRSTTQVCVECCEQNSQTRM